MTILITGQKGFIGSHLLLYLVNEGHEVVPFEGDVSDKICCENFKISKKIDLVIHAAAVINKRDKYIFEKVNIDGTKHIIELCRRLNVSRLIFLSTIRVLSSLNNPYISSKREAEKMIINSGLAYTILRPSMIYGPGDDKNIGFFIKAAKFMPIMPLLNFKMQPVFIDDIIKIISACLNYQSGTILNITGLEIITFADLLKSLKSLNYRFYIINLPIFFSFTIKLFSWLPFFPLTPWQVRGLFANEIFNGSSWSEQFNIKPTPFSEGIFKTIKAFQR